MLMKAGQYVPLTPKALETLVVLVEHGGQIVDKQELLSQVWPDTFVEDSSLAKNVSMLRKALGDCAEQRYIDTVPKRGYRFAGELRLVNAAEPVTPFTQASSVTVALEQTAIPSVLPAASTRRRQWFKSWWLLAGLLIATAGTGGLWMSGVLAHRSGATLATGRTIPLTSSPGHENQATFSPDGRQFVYVWDRPREAVTHLYLKEVGSETPRQLTFGKDADAFPAWSPDGQSVAFLRTSTTERAWYLVPASGGPERRLTSVFPHFDLGHGNSPYFSPDGRAIAIVDKRTAADPASIYLLRLDTLERIQITAPPPGTTGDYFPAFSPDGKMLAFARAHSFSATDLYAMTLPRGTPRRLTFDGLTMEGLAWTSDSSTIVFSSRHGGALNSLWRIPAQGGSPERIPTVGKDVISPAVAPRGSHLAYTQALDDMNIWRVALDGADASKARESAPVLASTFRESDPDYAPDGRRIAFTSARSGGFGIWIANRDGSDPHLVFDGGGYVTGTPRWSPDGEWLVFDSRVRSGDEGGTPAVYVVKAQGPSQPVRLTGAQEGAVAPSWSHDGRWIYFASPRSGRMEVWRVPAFGGPSVAVTREGGYEAFESSDGNWLYYTKARTTPGIWRMPVGGGTPELVTDREGAGMWRYWRLAGSRLFFVVAGTGASGKLEWIDLATGALHHAATLSAPPELNIPGLAVSPDGREVLYARFDQSDSDVMMMEEVH